MNLLTYNASMATSLTLASSGAAIQWGAGIGLMVAGALVMVITLVTLKFVA